MLKKVYSESVIKHDGRMKPANVKRGYPFQVVFTEKERELFSDLTKAVRLDKDFADENGSVTMSSVVRRLIQVEAEKRRDVITAVKNAEAKIQKALGEA